MKHKNIAFLVIDFTNEFVRGKIKSPNALKAIKPAKALIDYAHKNNIQVIYANDEHNKDDIEFNIWGTHSLKNTNASKVIKELNVNKKDIIIPKHTYNAFVNTKLHSTLKKLKIDTLIIFGLYISICVKYSLIEAYLHGYNTYLVKDATAGFTKEDYEASINEIKNISETKIVNHKQIINLLNK